MLDKYLDKVILGDCTEVMKDIPSESVDMCFADPPFNLGKNYKSYDDKRPDDEYLEWSRIWLNELVRIVKPTGSIFVHNIPRWLVYFGAILNESAYFRHWIAWDAKGHPFSNTLVPSHYGILYYTKRPKGYKFYDIRSPHKRCRICSNYLADYGGKKYKRHPFGPLVSDVWNDIDRIRNGSRRDEHPCQLPVPLLERIILMSTDPGDIVVDPFLGTGTTAIAAKALGRHYIGIEIDPFYTNLSEEKLQKVLPSIYKGYYVSYYLGNIQTIRDVDVNELISNGAIDIDGAIQSALFKIGT